MAVSLYFPAELSYIYFVFFFFDDDLTFNKRVSLMERKEERVWERESVRERENEKGERERELERGR